MACGFFREAQVLTGRGLLPCDVWVRGHVSVFRPNPNDSAEQFSDEKLKAYVLDVNACID